MKRQVPRHDLDLPAWGPYTKKYVGLSHVTDQERGLRFDLSVFPGVYRRRVDVPRVTWESAYHPWESSADRNYFSHRHEVEWKDRVYADISFSRLDDHRRLVRCELVNRTDLPQSLTLNFMASLNFPPIRTYSEERLRPARVDLPDGVSWVPALDYAELTFARPRPQDNLGYDGQFRGETRDHGFVDGQAVGAGFGADRGDTVEWRVTVTHSVEAAGLLLRFRLPQEEYLSLKCEGVVDREIRLQGSGDIDTVVLPIGRLTAGEHRFRLTSTGGQPLDTDGFAWGTLSALTRVRFPVTNWNPVAMVRPGPVDRSLALSYPDTDVGYGLVWSDIDGDLRQYHVAELDRFLRHYVHEHVKKVFRDEGDEHFTNVHLRPLGVAPRSTRVVYAVVVDGIGAEVDQRLALGLPADPEATWARARDTTSNPVGNPAGDPYRFSQEKLAATVLTNVVFPVYVRRSYIRHSTPGKWWDCLYTWDSGFIGLGLLELDPTRASENLRAYLTEPGDPNGAFLHHGSPVPVQFALFQELWNRTLDLELARWAYPRLREMYLFLSGQSGSSTTNALGTDLLKTWDYFYNSGGWDDYPPQVHVHTHRLTDTVTPVITTAHAIRMAKILNMTAGALGLEDRYDADIARFTRALQDHAWDEESGYFGYVTHSPDGVPQGVLRHASGANFNQGLDGIYPLVAGICTPAQESRALEHLSTPGQLWTDVGITTVDQRSPYYRIDGYWNGAVWMAHQWFFWKALLDVGQGAFAWKVARTALEAARRETDETYLCMEHWVVDSGRGAGWHHFGGLSSPVLSWFGAYFVPGRLSVGYDTLIRSRSDARDGSRLDVVLEDFGPRPRSSSVVVVLKDGGSWRANWKGQTLPMTPLVPGAWSLDLAVEPATTGRLVIVPA